MADKRAAGFLLLASTTLRLAMGNDLAALLAERERYSGLLAEKEQMGQDPTVFRIGLLALDEAVNTLR